MILSADKKKEIANKLIATIRQTPTHSTDSDGAEVIQVTDASSFQLYRLVRREDHIQAIEENLVLALAQVP